MACPNCNKKNYCGCGSCKTRKGLDNRRSFRFVKGDFIKCAYCRTTNHIDVWESYEYSQIVKQ